MWESKGFFLGHEINWNSKHSQIVRHSSGPAHQIAVKSFNLQVLLTNAQKCLELEGLCPCAEPGNCHQLLQVDEERVPVVLPILLCRKFPNMTFPSFISIMFCWAVFSYVRYPFANHSLLMVDFVRNKTNITKRRALSTSSKPLDASVTVIGVKSLKSAMLTLRAKEHGEIEVWPEPRGETAAWSKLMTSNDIVMQRLLPCRAHLCLLCLSEILVFFPGPFRPFRGTKTKLMSLYLCRAVVPSYQAFQPDMASATLIRVHVLCSQLELHLFIATQDVKGTSDTSSKRNAGKTAVQTFFNAAFFAGING